MFGLGRTHTTPLSKSFLTLVGFAWLAQAQIGAPIDLGSAQKEGSLDSSVAITLSAAAPAGSSIIVIASDVATSAPASIACSDSQSHTYTTDVTKKFVFNFGAICATHGIAPAMGSGQTITVTFMGGSVGLTPDHHFRARAFAVTGLMASNALDQTASGIGTNGAPSIGPTGTTSQANEFLIAAVLENNGAASASDFTAGLGYTALAPVGSVPSILFGEYQIVSAAGAYTATGTLALAHPLWLGVLATYKAAPCQPPTINSLSATPNVLWPPNNKLVPITVTPTTSGGCAAVSCHIKSVTSSEPPDSQPDWVFNGTDLALQLRAERLGTRVGTGNGRVYTITVQCTDGTSSPTKTTTVLVPHDQGH